MSEEESEVGPRNGNVEVIKSSAHRIEYVLQNYPSLRDQIEQMLDGNKNEINNNKRCSPSRNIHPIRLQSLNDVVIDDDANTKTKNKGLPYFVPTKSVVTQVANLTTKPALPPFSAIMEVSSKDEAPDDENHLTLPTPYNMFNRKSVSMSICSSSLGTQLLLPAPADNSLDDLQKSLISSSYQQHLEGKLPLNTKNYPEHGINLYEMFRTKNEDTCTRISLPSPPSHFSLSSSPRSTCTNYPPTPTSSASPPLSPHIKSKRSSIHLLSKPAPWCANVINEDREDRTLYSHFQPNHLMETDCS
ncbi:3472_t:CDS:2 [Funneliformis caledonium]|uniref:3472_t:CDS:1 n=1 Tax=Funneliformis caledonium TaxID=1117310 RepID=A0A9N8ZYD8_9GLOM|nr:3472_t:CDS:2 [Funneliformis caledonium]